MARHIQSRLRIRGELVAETPLHVGGYGESFETDLALARNGKDEFYIPGTSLAGSLRSWFEKHFPSEVNAVWGYQDGEQGHASFVMIEDLTLPEQIQSELRDGVGIDRVYGTAADQVKFDRAILPKGTRLNLEMTLDIQEGATEVKARFERLLGALQEGHIRLGASKTRGLGRVKCGPIGIEEYSLYDEGILNAVEKKPTTKYQIQNLKTTAQDGSQLLTIEVKWKPKSPLMVKAGYEGVGIDILPLTSRSGKDVVSLVLPGSSIKGAFRAQAERILRTLLDIEAPRKSSDRQSFSNQIRILGKDGKETDATKIIGALFGAKKERDDEAKGRTSTLGLGALSIDDCYFGKEMNVSDWEAVETGRTRKSDKGKEEEITYTEQELWKALKHLEGETDLASPTSDFTISHHVAIDRWTGGASEGALFSILQPTAKTGWEDISLNLDLSRFRDIEGNPDSQLKKRCLMLLLLVLRDFAENRLPLGFAANRGMGEVVVEKIEGLDAIPRLLELPNELFQAEIQTDKLIFKGDKVKEELKSVWFQD